MVKMAFPSLVDASDTTEGIHGTKKRAELHARAQAAGLAVWHGLRWQAILGAWLHVLDSGPR